ncbi:type IV pilus modification protein PilV [Orenia metallireducens]|uniref:Type IV pilus modification protein PilV n=2 Tax=Orenia metallireducens TaxID=1413210 RepID=A0A285GVP6_9FIRM|nr:type IV pilus modification protein PilV [Orenia metallireducens]
MIEREVIMMSWNTSYLKKEEGITLIEILIGIIILAIILTSVIGFFTNSTKITGQAKDRRRALQLARSVMEDMRSAFYQEGISISDRQTHFNNWENNEDYKGYTCRVNIADYKEDLKEVIVTVYWDNKNKNLKLKTLITKR